jgi:hypothetical protein
MRSTFQVVLFLMIMMMMCLDGLKIDCSAKIILSVVTRAEAPHCNVVLVLYLSLLMRLSTRSCKKAMWLLSRGAFGPQREPQEKR